MGKKFPISNFQFPNELKKSKNKFGIRHSAFGNYRKGFTLIELLIVITLVGILATVSINTYSGYQKKARDGQRKFDLRNLQSALEQYYSQQPTQQYPGNVNYDQLFTNHLGPSPGQGLLKAQPKDPASSQTYFYQGLGSGCGTASGCQNYVLCANLESSTDTDIYPAGPTKLTCVNGGGPSSHNYGITAP